MKITKNRKQMLNNFDTSKIYEPLEAIKILKEKSFVKFKETIDISINLGIDSNKTDQNIKGVVNLPNGDETIDGGTLLIEGNYNNNGWGSLYSNSGWTITNAERTESIGNAGKVYRRFICFPKSYT